MTLASRISLLEEMFGNTADASFAVDGERRIIFGNDAFSRLCRRDISDVRGRRCYEIVCGRTLGGGRFCAADCRIGLRMAQRDKIDNFDISIPAGGLSVWVNVGVLPLPRSWSPLASVAILRPITLPAIVDRFGGARDNERATTAAPRLTQRERQVLRLLAEGQGTRAIAQRLHISALTVRNHLRHIYARLGIRTRAEAVGFAFRHHLL